MVKQLSYIVALATATLMILLLPPSSMGETLSGSVARLRSSEGEVYVRPLQGGSWIEAQGNMPLSSGTEISTASGGFAEIEFSGKKFVRLREQSMVTLLAIGNDLVNLEFINGGVYVSSLLREGPSIHIVTPRGTEAFLQEPGSFRIDWDTRQGTGITPRDGSVEISQGGHTKTIKVGETAWVDGNMVIAKSQNRDDWDEFISRRDGEIAALSPSLQMDGEYPGRYDLAGYGEWIGVPQYGRVWRPFVPTGWAPFRYGRWTFIGSFGWTWISYAPWGWVPYHYGSWVTLSPYGWVWVPVPRYTYWYPSRARIVYRNRLVHITPLRPVDIYRAPPRRFRYRRYSPLFNRNSVGIKGRTPYFFRRGVINRKIGRRVITKPLARPKHRQNKLVKRRIFLKKQGEFRKKPSINVKRKRLPTAHRNVKKKVSVPDNLSRRNNEGVINRVSRKREYFEKKPVKKPVEIRKNSGRIELKGERVLRNRRWSNRGALKIKRRGSFARKFMRR